MAELIRVAICDDHAVVRSGLRAILAVDREIDVVGEAGSVGEAEKLAADARPDVFIMDINLPDGTGFDATRKVLAASPETNVIVLTVHDDVAYLKRAFDAGVTGYLIKEAADLELVLAVRQVATGERYVHPRLGAALLDNPGAATERLAGPGGELSERELDVLKLIAQGYTNAQAAEELFVSVRTIETHRAHIQQKLGVRSRAELVKAASESGLLDQA
ncbi:MAG: response regulator transcription factor [Actinobacteria bacterium]|nr:response regulator transcription factor [Actinomycetota bacterium]